MKKPKPPNTIQEVENYIDEKGLRVDAKTFWRFFNDVDPQWHDSNGAPVRCWKRKLLTWDGYSTKPKPPTKAEREAITSKQEAKKKQDKRDLCEGWLNAKSDGALHDLKADGDQISHECGWLIDEILRKRNLLGRN